MRKTVHHVGFRGKVYSSDNLAKAMQMVTRGILVRQGAIPLKMDLLIIVQFFLMSPNNWLNNLSTSENAIAEKDATTSCSHETAGQNTNAVEEDVFEKAFRLPDIQPYKAKINRKPISCQPARQIIHTFFGKNPWKIPHNTDVFTNE